MPTLHPYPHPLTNYTSPPFHCPVPVPPGLTTLHHRYETTHDGEVGECLWGLLGWGGNPGGIGPVPVPIPPPLLEPLIHFVSLFIFQVVEVVLCTDLRIYYVQIIDFSMSYVQSSACIMCKS